TEPSLSTINTISCIDCANDSIVTENVVENKPVNNQGNVMQGDSPDNNNNNLNSNFNRRPRVNVTSRGGHNSSEEEKLYLRKIYRVKGRFRSFNQSLVLQNSTRSFLA